MVHFNERQGNKIMNKIIDLCNTLTKTIHDPLHHNFYNVPNELKHKQTFT